jgi:serine/threonine-protein kinase
MSPEFLALQDAVAGRYAIERELGRGGMGVVFLARDVALDRPVAIKLLPPALAASPRARERFLREARAAARLSHPHIVPVHAVEASEGPGALAFFVMGYVDGETLGARVRRAGPLPAAEAMRVVQEVAWALGHAHAAGVVHRDVKPDNILLERDTGRALVADFGVAQLTVGDAEQTPATGLPVGTPHYMSPEQGAGERADARSDLYALGVTAFLAATGRLPFEGPTAVALLAQHAVMPAPPLLSVRPSLPPRFAAAVDRCLAKDPAARFASAEELAAALRDARGAVPETPVPVRGFLREAGAAGGEIGTALAASGASLAVLGGTLAFDSSLFAWVSVATYASAAALAGALAGIRGWRVVSGARALLRRGYGHGAVRAALAAEARERADDVGALAPTPAGGRRRVATVSAGALATGVGVALTNGDVPLVVGLAGLATSIVAPTLTARALWCGWAPGRDVWERMLAGGVGRAAFRAAGVGLPSAERAALPPANEPTMVALGRAAGELFDALPAAERARFAEVPALVARLQDDAERLEARAGDDPAAAERRQLTVAALEAVRLDLLRLHAGRGSADQLTRDLEAARQLGARVDAALEHRHDPARDPVPTPA